MGIFDLDLTALLTGYLFLSFGSIQAAIFALGQGLLMDIFSSGPTGLSALIYFGVFWVIYLGSFFFNLEAAKGQIIIVSLAVFVKTAIWQGSVIFLYGAFVFSPSWACTAAVSIVGTGLIAPLLYALFDRWRGAAAGEDDCPALEDIENSPGVKDHY